ncbi:MAG TPA: transcription termination factor NusA [Pirellulaceae bacterium]|jgi:N utilization substance protein A
MNPADMLRIVDSLHREKAIDKEIVFQAIESALITAAKKHYGELADVVVTINRETGEITGTHAGEPMDEAEISGRIGAQTAKQVIIQKIREAERDSLLGKFGAEIGAMITGVVTRNEGPATIVAFDGIEAILPRSEQIPGESHHPNERVRAVIFEVKPQGSRVKVVLSRTRPQLVQRLFEQEIPEIADGVISIQAISREPGHRSKVAVSSSDQRVDCVGACVGVRGNRIKNIVDELAGERIDIVRYNEDAETLIRAALQPAEVDQVLLCNMLGRAIVLVREDQLSLAIGRKGQNVRLASKLCGWDIEIMTNDELEQQIERAVAGFMQIEGMTEELAQRLVEQGYLSYDDLSVIEPDDLMEMGSMTEEQVNAIVTQAETLAEQAEKAADDEKRRKRAEDAAAAAAGPAEGPPATPATTATSGEPASAEPTPAPQQGETAG